MIRALLHSNNFLYFKREKRVNLTLYAVVKNILVIFKHNQHSNNRSKKKINEFTFKTLFFLN